MISNEDFEGLLTELKFTTFSAIDPRDVTLYYAEWWKKSYHGGIPSKSLIFEFLSEDNKFGFNHHEFYKLAKKGAHILGVKWVTKQNTLYFRTLLLQGGLPLSHISENHSSYQNFLLAVLEEQPETIEDFIFKPQITNLLPSSSQNNIIYENCFEIVKSILNNENEYDDLLGSNDALISISKKLKVRKQSLERRQRLSKPKNYWLLSLNNFNKEEIGISLRIGLADTYDTESLSNILGFDATGKEYQFYLNEELICIFRKMLNGNFKTDWYHNQNQEWNGESNLPYAYVIKEGEKIEVRDFIQTIPNLSEPSLWAKFSDDEWRLIKGNGTSNKEAAVLFPTQWNSDTTPLKISINNEHLNWLTFEGTIEIHLDEDCKKYLSEVNSLDWTIVSQKPAWMLKASMPVVQKKPIIIIYDEKNKKLPDHKVVIWIKKHQSSESWQELSILNNIPLGCIDVKIEKEGLIAYDMFFNIGNLKADYTHKAIDNAEIGIKNLDSFEFNLDESPILQIKHQDDAFSLRVKTEYSKIPTGIKGDVGNRNQKKLFFEMESPFEGMVITDKDGRIIPEDEQITLANLYGLRILSTPNTGTILRIKNRLKPDVIISKEIKESSQPIISFKEEIIRLYYLADAMDYRNKVCLELIEGKNSKIYEVSGFSHNLNVEEQFQNNLCLLDSDDELDLYAIPLNCTSENIELIPLVRNELLYTIPSTEITNQFIVISSKEDGKQLMPRFVNTDVNIIGTDKNTRIESYHKQLSERTFDDQIWKQLLSYFNICTENDIPFSTFDQLRSISRSSRVAARAFFYLGSNQLELNNFIQKAIPEMEMDLGFCFHWIKKDDWEYALYEINGLNNHKYIKEFFSLISSYMQENGLQELLQFITGTYNGLEKIYNTDILDLRSNLGERVLKELPYASPKITKEYHIPIMNHRPVKLLLRAPIAVAESIKDTQKEFPIWAGDDHRDSIRRNIQYSQYLNPEFYKRVILHALENN
ncbi:MAG: hypothetical protein CVU00_11700 [Bacteroidetes bacterium HGW-Bacteroidetes-17]|jgi:hypothetical protein|nr:MAG: hypothetical protein CVU00_11700 [Bacteroidetes bacterium HGW-Bacteroidetes-17]